MKQEALLEIFNHSYIFSYITFCLPYYSSFFPTHFLLLLFRFPSSFLLCHSLKYSPIKLQQERSNSQSVMKKKKKYEKRNYQPISITFSLYSRLDITVLTSQSREKELTMKDYNKTFIRMTYGKTDGSGTQQTHSG